MSFTPLVFQPNLSYYPPTFTCCSKPCFRSREMPQKVLGSNFSRRRVGGIAAMVSILLAQEVIFGQEVAEGFELKMVAPGQTFEEAMSEIRGHAQALLQIKSLIESESWGEAQKVLRKNSAYLKQDIYTIIQGIPGNERPQLRKLYSNLFNNATRLDYAARDKDASRVWQCYDNIVVALNDILSRI
ncbi:psbQ-like protein 3, chloroplastic [Quercus suber]|nr:psbQ-like protein 3, chloroplastic [Quercus suber]XP_023894737.1 psbQ-like protein 3, chloroplastic [Quercus suber]